MPTYEYKCPECGWTTELRMSIEAYATVRVVGCIHCAVPMKRVFRAPGIIFKGSGWACKT